MESKTDIVVCIVGAYATARRRQRVMTPSLMVVDERNDEGRLREMLGTDRRRGDDDDIDRLLVVVIVRAKRSPELN